MYKVHLGLQPKCNLNLYCENNDIQNYNTRQKDIFIHPFDELLIYIFFNQSKFGIKSCLILIGNFFGKFKNKLREYILTVYDIFFYYSIILDINIVLYLM